MKGTFVETVEDVENHFRQRHCRTMTWSPNTTTTKEDEIGWRWSDDETDASDGDGLMNSFGSDFTDDSHYSDVSECAEVDLTVSECAEVDHLAPPLPTRLSLEESAAALNDYATQLRAAATNARKLATAAGVKQHTAFQQPAPSTNGHTTLMFKNLPNDYSRDMLCAMLDSEGFAGLYDFVYLPRDFKKDAGFGYAFVNWLDHDCAVTAMQRWQGFNRWMVPSRKVLEVVWSNPHQGLDSHVQRYRNSPIMHDQMSDDYKPILLKAGIRVPFPSPTKRLRAPRRACKDLNLSR